MIQSITFSVSGNLMGTATAIGPNTWNDWGLLPMERPIFAPPLLKTTYIDVPGGNGSLDLTESLTGYPIYNNRTGSLDLRGN